MDPVSKPKKDVFGACFRFGDRFFDMNLFDDGSTRWYDNTAENEIAKVDGSWDMKTDIFAYGFPESMKLWDLLHREFTIHASLPKSDFNFIVKKLLPGYRRKKSYRSTEATCIRAILLQFFWKEFNPQFSPPVPEGTAEKGW
jgi:hypothetical protein